MKRIATSPMLDGLFFLVMAFNEFRPGIPQTILVAGCLALAGAHFLQAVQAYRTTKAS